MQGLAALRAARRPRLPGFRQRRLRHIHARGRGGRGSRRASIEHVLGRFSGDDVRHGDRRGSVDEHHARQRNEPEDADERQVGDGEGHGHERDRGHASRRPGTRGVCWRGRGRAIAWRAPAPARTPRLRSVRRVPFSTGRARRGRIRLPARSEHRDDPHEPPALERRQRADGAAAQQVGRLAHGKIRRCCGQVPRHHVRHREPAKQLLGVGRLRRGHNPRDRAPVDDDELLPRHAPAAASWRPRRTRPTTPARPRSTSRP